jgi:transposase
VTPLPKTRVICIDEWGPLAVKSYPGAEWLPGEMRATFEPDYGRRGMLWVHGALEPATGQATIVLSERRDGASHLQLLARIPAEFPAQRWLIVEDNLSIHKSRDVKTALLAWSEFQILYLPKYAAWLNLIEPWWKQLNSLTRKGRRFETTDALAAALMAGVEYWNLHKHPYLWKKRPQEQPSLLLGGFSSASKIYGVPI